MAIDGAGFPPSCSYKERASKTSTCPTKLSFKKIIILRSFKLNQRSDRTDSLQESMTSRVTAGSSVIEQKPYYHNKSMQSHRIRKKVANELPLPCKT